jgi:hypothetical protein
MKNLERQAKRQIRSLYGIALPSGEFQVQAPNDSLARLNSLAHLRNSRGHFRSLVKLMLDYSSSGVRNRGIDTAIRGFYELERMILHESIRRAIRDGILRATDVDRLAALICVHLDG